MTTPNSSSRQESGQTLGAFSGVAQDGPARQKRPVALAEELNSRGCKFIESGIWDEAEREFRKALKMAPEYPEALNNLGLSLIYDSRPNEAVEALKEALRIFPNWSLAEANLGLALQQCDQFVEAIQFYRQSIAHKPGQTQVLLSLGDVLHAAGNPEDALATYQNALEILPNFALAHHRIGMLHTRRGKINEAENSLLRAAQLDPSNAEANAVLGAIAARRGNLTQAKDFFTKIIVEPMPAVAQKGSQRIAIMESAAQKSLEQWKASQPESKPLAQCYFDLGISLLRASKYSEATTMIQKAAQLDPKWLAPQFFQAYSQMNSGEALQAKATLERIAQAEPDNGAVYAHQGYIALGMGLLKESQAQFQKAQSLGYDLPPELIQTEGQ